MRILCFFVLLASTAQATVGQQIGYTSRAAALGGAMVASGSDSASAFQNPASLSGEGDFKLNRASPRVNFHWSLLYLEPSLKPIDQVVVSNEYTSDLDPSATPSRKNVDMDYPATFGQSLGLSYQFQGSPAHWSFGFVTFLPLENLALVDSGESYVPEYTLLRSQSQRPEFDLGFGVRPSSPLSLGFGIHLGTQLNANTTVFLQTDQSKPSTMRVTAGLKTKASPYFGAQLQLSPDLRLGAVARLPLAQRQKIRVNAAGRAISTIAALDFNYDALGTMFYDPFSFETGASLNLGPNQRILVQLDYQRWSSFESPMIEIQDPSTTNCASCGGGVSFSGSKSQSHPLQDLIVPHLGYELGLTDAWILRAGYSYKGSIYQDLPTGAGNPLDPPAHRFSAGLGKEFAHFLEFNTPCRLDLHLSFQQLVTQSIRKSAGNEAGSGSGDRKVGAPGYEAGGYLWGGGLSLAVML